MEETDELEEEVNINDNPNNFAGFYFIMLLMLMSLLGHCTGVFGQQANIGGVMVGDEYISSDIEVSINDIKGNIYSIKDYNNKIASLIYVTEDSITYDEWCSLMKTISESLFLIMVPSLVENDIDYLTTFKFYCIDYTVIIKVNKEQGDTKNLFLSVIVYN